MYLSGLCFDCGDKKSAFGSLGMDWLSMGASLLTSGAGKSGGGGAPITNTVATSVNTQVSPQISPVFVQQDEPQGSPVNASVSMAAQPMPGQMPGVDYSQFTPQASAPPKSITPYVLTAAALIGVAWFVREH